MSNLARLLQTALAGAEAQNLPNDEIRTLMRELVNDDQREVDRLHACWASQPLR